MMETWHDYLKTDKVLLTVLVLVLLGIWAWKPSEQVFQLINTIIGALLGLVTGSLIKNGRNGPPAPPGGTISDRPL